MPLAVQPQRQAAALPTRNVIPPELLPVLENSAISHPSLHCFPVSRKTRPEQTAGKDAFVAGLRLNRKKLRVVRRREGRYLLRTNLTGNDPALLWQYYIQLVAVEEAFKNLKGDLAIRPIFHKDEGRIEAHIFIAFLAYCLHVTLQRRLHALAPGLTARSALEKFAAVQMIDVHLPTTDGRELLLTRYTQPDPELQLLIGQLKLRLPPQPPPRITSTVRT
jgi:hypothetical protein